MMKKVEETFHPREPGLEASKGMQDHQKQPEVKAVGVAREFGPE